MHYSTITKVETFHLKSDIEWNGRQCAQADIRYCGDRPHVHVHLQSHFQWMLSEFTDFSSTRWTFECLRVTFFSFRSNFPSLPPRSLNKNRLQDDSNKQTVNFESSLLALPMKVAKKKASSCEVAEEKDVEKKGFIGRQRETFDFLLFLHLYISRSSILTPSHTASHNT